VVHRRVVLRAVPPVAVPAALRGVIVAAIVMATEVVGAADDVAVVGGAAQRERLDPRHGLLPAQRPAPAVSPAARGRQGVAVPLRLLALRKRLPGTRQRNAAAAAAAAPERTVKVRRGKWDLLGPTAPAVRRPPGTEAPGRP